MTGALALALRAIWWRRGASVVVLVVAVFASGTAAAGPLFLQGAGESVLRDTLSSAPANAAGTGAEVTKDASGRSGSTPLQAAVSLAMPGSVAAAYPQRVVSLERPTRVVDARGASLGRVTVVHRDQACAHLRLVSGRCMSDTGSDEVVVSAADARRLRWAVGDTVRIDAFHDPETPNGPTVATLRLVGTYAPADIDGGYWFNATRRYFGGDDRRRDEAQGQPASGRTLEAAFVGSGAFATVTASSAIQVVIVEDLILDPEAVTLAALPALRAGLDDFGIRLRAAGLNQDFYSASLVRTGVRQVLDTADAGVASLQTPITVVLVELVLLGLFVLFIVVAAAAEARGGEVALAKLRGLPTGTTFSFGLLETVILLLVAAPIGALIALAWLGAVAHSLFATGLAVHASVSMWAAVALTAAGGLGAAVLASLRSLRRPVVEQWRRTAARRSRRGAALEAAVFVLTAAALWQQWRGQGIGTPRPGTAPDLLSLVAPTLFALAGALVVARAVPRLAALTGRWTRRSRQVGLFIGARELSRRPGGTRLLVVLTTAFALACFSAVAAQVFAANRVDRAGTEIGADRVVRVDPYSPVDIRAVVHQLDPGGTQAMAVADLDSSVFGATSADQEGGSGPSRIPFSLLVVDAPRLASTAFWRHDFSATSVPDLVHGLQPAFTSPPTWHGEVLTATLNVHVACCGAITATIGATDPRGRSFQLPLGRLREGTQTLTIPTPQCRQQACALRRIRVTRDDAGGYSVVGDLRLTALTAQLQGGPPTPVEGATDPARWQTLTAAEAVAQAAAGDRVPGGDPPERVGGSIGALSLAFVAPSQVREFGLAAAVPATVPAVATASYRPGPGTDGYLVTVPTGAPFPVRIVGTTEVLPRAGVRGLIVPWDVLAAARALGDDQVVADQVWLGPRAPADFPNRLAAAGVTVTGVDTPAEREDSLARQGPGLAVTFLLAGASAAAALAVGAAVVNLFLMARRRSFELAALRALGFSPRTVLAAALAEQIIVAALAVVVGVTLGVVAARLGLPSIPEFADGGGVPPVLIRVDPVRVLIVAGVLTGLLGAGVVVGGAGLLSSSGPTRLREGQA